MATLTIPDKLYKRLQAAAASQQQSIDDYLFDVIEKAAPDEAASDSAPLTREEEMRRIREVMKDRIWTQEDIDEFFDNLGLQEMSDEEAERIVAAIPPLDPPMSHVLIQMREEERY
jgi:hypothetical protein